MNLIKIIKEADFKKIAERVIKKLKPEKEALVLGLRGELGAGKTTFVKYLVKELGGKEEVISPTFILMYRYNLPAKVGWNNFYHLDAYRLEKENDLDILGWQKIIKEAKNIVVIEWPDKVDKKMPLKTRYINFKHGKNKEERVVEIDF